MEACARYCDLVSINYYARWQPETDFLANLKAWCGTNLLVSEFYTKAEDATYKGIKYANVEGGGWLVRTQKNRGEFHQNFCLRLLEAEIVLAGYTLNIMMATIRMEKRPIKELSLSNMNLINHSCCRCDS